MSISASTRFHAGRWIALYPGSVLKCVFCGQEIGISSRTMLGEISLYQDDNGCCEYQGARANEPKAETPTPNSMNASYPATPNTSQGQTP